MFFNRLRWAKHDLEGQMLLGVRMQIRVQPECFPALYGTIVELLQSSKVLEEWLASYHDSRLLVADCSRWYLEHGAQAPPFLHTLPAMHHLQRLVLEESRHDSTMIDEKLRRYVSGLCSASLQGIPQDVSWR